MNDPPVWNRWSWIDLVIVLLSAGLGYGLGDRFATIRPAGEPSGPISPLLVGWLAASTTWILLTVGVQFLRGRNVAVSLGEWAGLVPGLVAGCVTVVRSGLLPTGDIAIYLLVLELLLLALAFLAAAGILLLYAGGTRNLLNAWTDLAGCLIVITSSLWITVSAFSG